MVVRAASKRLDAPRLAVQRGYGSIRSHGLLPSRTTSPLRKQWVSLRSYGRPEIVDSRDLLSRYKQPSRRLSTSPFLRSSSRVMINDMPNQELIIETTTSQAVRFPSFWLRDHCQCSECSHPSTHQRQLDTFNIDPSIKAASISTTTNGLSITWSDPTHHTSHFPWSWLQTHTPFPAPTTNAIARHQESRPWKPLTPTTPLLTTPYPSLTTSPNTAGLRSLVSQIQTFGLSFISSTPPTPTATSSLLSSLFPLRNTHYGPFWDFTSVASPIDTAYTNEFLPLHTDNTYFTDPAGLQVFHLLSHTTSDVRHGKADVDGYDDTLGGGSTFSDGFAAATTLFNTSPQSYAYLSTLPIASHASGSPAGPIVNTSLHTPGHPVLSHCTTNAKDFRPENLTQIRWNNLDRSPLTQWPSHTAMLGWYRAAKQWSTILEDTQIDVKLRPGAVAVFDNWRILHGRKAFEGRRRVCGAYVGMDDWRALVRKESGGEAKGRVAA